MNPEPISPLVAGARELTELELMQVQGGGFFSTVGGWASSAASAVVNAVTHPVDSFNALVASKPFKVAASIAGVIIEIYRHPPPPTDPY